MNTQIWTATHYIEYQNASGTWVDMSAYVVSDLDAEWGIQGYGVLDRLADVGTLKLDVNNENGEFSPAGSIIADGFRKGTPIRHRITFDGREIIRYKAYVDDIQVDDLYAGDKYAHISCVDWMEYPSTFPLEGFNIETNKRIDEAVQLLNVALPTLPAETDLKAGDSTFPTVFDSLRDKITAYSEYYKLVVSEFGRMYLRKNYTSGEQLVTEGRTYRDTLSEYSRYFISKNDANVLFMHSGTPTPILYLNANTYLLLNSSRPAVFTNMATNIEQRYGDNFYNEVRMTSYPRRVDTVLQTLWETPQRIALAAGETKSNLKITYKDPTGGSARVNADPDTMVTPVQTTDYTLYLNSDGTGTNLTANLIVSGSFAPEGSTFSITNNGGTDGYAWLRFRGYGIYIQDPLTYLTNDTDSIARYKHVSPISVDQKYLADPYLSQNIAATLLVQGADPSNELVAINYIANSSDTLFRQFLFLDVGDYIPIIDDANSINGGYFIQNMKYKMTPSGEILVRMGVIPATSSEVTAWLLDVDGRSELGITTILGY